MPSMFFVYICINKYIQKLINMDSQAKALNDIILKNNPNIMDMLSERGKNIFFPKLGILSQSAQAKDKNINATIGIAVEDNGNAMHLPEFDQYVNLPVGKVFPYAPSPGNPALRDEWKKMIFKKNPSLGNTVISNPIATNGLTHGLSMAGYMFVDTNDSVLLSDLYWENYDLIFENAYGAKPETFNLFSNGGFDVESLGEKLNDNKHNKIILLLNFPNNPSGYTPTTSEIDPIVKQIEKAALKGKKIVVVIDDAYFGLVYEDNVYQESIFVKLASLHENILAVKLDGATKEDYVWGFRTGFITFAVKNGTQELYQALESKLGGAIRGNISNISQLSQSLLLSVYTSNSYETSKKQKYDIMKSRYIKLKKTLNNSKYNAFFEVLPFNSGYFMCVKINAKLNAEEIRKHLLEKYSTGVIVFGNVIRLAFSATPESKIETLVENLYNACNDLS